MRNNLKPITITVCETVHKKVKEEAKKRRMSASQYYQYSAEMAIENGFK